MHIYITENKVNGKKYIGMSSRDDETYYGSGALIKSAIKKYGKENFTKTVLEQCETFTQMCEAEARWIEEMDAVESPDFYNLNTGGLGGNVELLKEFWSSMTEEERKEARNWNGHFMNAKFDGYDDPEYRKALSAGVKNTWDSYSDEERNDRSAKIKSGIIKNRRRYNGKSNPMAGRSAVTEKNLKWYTNGIDSIYVTEGTEPKGFVRGRKMKKRKAAK